MVRNFVSRIATRSEKLDFIERNIEICLNGIKCRMFGLRVFTFCFFISITVQQDAVISGYGPINLDDLHPMTLSWNQVR